jgi:hypothetical protein
VFAITGFIVGLIFTLCGGDTIDIAYPRLAPLACC